MSCHLIEYKDGAKIMRPVLTREKFLELRGLAVHVDRVNQVRQGNVEMKSRLLQFNYSCIPGEDGKLKGCKTPSTTIAMDIDHIKPEEMEPMVKKILQKKAETRLLFLETSVRKEGLHLAMQRMEGLSQEENLEKVAEILGVEYDKAAKDITRVFFATTNSDEDLLYLDDELFSLTPSVTALQCDSGKDTAPKGDGGMYHGIARREIVEKYWELFNEGKLPCEGDRNMKTYEIAMVMRPICDYSVEKLMEIIPQYDGFPFEEYKKTLENACNEPRKGMPYRLRQVLNALKKESGVKATGGTMTAPPPMPRHLPKLIKLLTRNVPYFYKPAVASAVFPSLGVHLHGVKFRYWDNVEHEATFMNLLVGRQSVGKGSIKEPIRRIIADIVARDKPNREREAEWKRKNPSGKGKAKDPRPSDICIQILIDNLTDAVFNQRVADADANGKRYIYTTVDEIEALKKVTSKGTVDEVSLLIRKAFDNSMAGQERVGADSVSGIAPLRWNWNASTTPPNARRFFNKAVNDGTVGRLDVATIMLNDDEDQDPILGIYDDDFNAELKPYIDRLESANGLVECPQAKRLSLQMKKENSDTAKLYDSEAYKIFSYRANVIAWLKGMVLYIADGYRWSKEIADFVKWSQDYNLWCKMLYFGQQLEEELRQENEIQHSAGPQNLLNLLPDSFTEEQYKHLRQQQGKKGDGASTLRQWKSRGHIEYDEIQQCYIKSEKYLGRVQGVQKV